MTNLDRCKAFFIEHGYIEFLDHRGSRTWRRTTGPSWDEDVEYRVPPMHWQPIETAPRDGNPILVADSGPYAFIVEWNSKLHVWLGTDRSAWEPTHWMPLPEPPKETSND